MGNVIAGTGSYLPERVLSNHDVARMRTDFDAVRAHCTLDEWCRSHTGALERRRAKPGEGTSDMATAAARRALADARVEPGDVDLLILATVTDDYPLPQTAGIVQANLGVECKFIQMSSGCTGFTDGLMVADGLMNTVGYQRVLVVGADTLSSKINPRDFRTLVTFGDGAGAVVLCRHPDARYGLKAHAAGSDGKLGSIVHIPGGGTRKPLTHDTLEQGLQYLQLGFGSIFPYALEKMVFATREAVRKAGISLADVRWFVPHQAAGNVITELARALELPAEKFINNFDVTGNTSSASVPIALDESRRAGKLSDGDWLVLPSVGVGMAWGASCLVWHDSRAAGLAAKATQAAN